MEKHTNEVHHVVRNRKPDSEAQAEQKPVNGGRRHGKPPLMADDNVSAISVFLPWPPSVNRIWRYHGKRVYKDPKYVAWITEAGWIVKCGKYKRIKGKFKAEIVLYPPDKRGSDPDNRIKVLLDLAQSMELIENDSMLRRLVVDWDEESTTPGALLKLEPMTP